MVPPWSDDRNFPTREDLVEAAHRNEVAQITGAVAGLLAEHPPDVALERWMERCVDYVVAKGGMGDALQLAALVGVDVVAGLDDRAVILLPQRDGWREQAARLLGLLVDGLRYRGRAR